MKSKKVFLLVFCFCLYQLGFTQKQQLRNIKLSVGQSIFKLNAPTKNSNGDIDWHFADSIKTEALLEEAITQALQLFGKEKPKMLWIMGRAENRLALKSAIEKANRDHIPYIFDGSNWDQYTVIGPKAVSNTLEQSFIVIALGGNADYQFHYQPVLALKEQYWELENKYGKDSTAIILSKEKTKYLQAAASLAKKFDTLIDGNKVFIQMGNLHTPKQSWVLEGISTVFDKINVIGGAQADWGWQIFDGQIVQSNLYGILITGDFQISQAMGKRNREEPIHLQSERIFKSAFSDLGKEPDYALYYGCAGWNADNDNQKRIIEQVIPNAITFGRFNGGEIGRYKTENKNDSGIDLLSVLFISNTKY